MAEQVDMQGLLSGLLPNRENADKAEGLRLADLVGKSGATAAYLQPAQARRLRNGVGGMFGLDMRNEAEKVEDQLRALGTPSTAEEHKKYADVLDKYKPGSGVTYMMGVAQEARDLTRANATATSAGAQETNANVNEEFEGRRVRALEAQLTVEKGKLDLAELTQEDLVDYRNMTGDQKDRELDIRKQEDETDRLLAANQAADLDSRSLAAIREQSKKAGEQRLLAIEVRNIANEFSRIEITGGVLGTMKEKWQMLTGTPDEETALKTKFNQIKNSLVMEALPPGVASDKDIEMAQTGFPTTEWNSEQLASYMRGMAKMVALQSAESEARSIFLSANGGDDSGFEAHWRETTNEAGFAAKLAQEKGLIWRPQKDAQGNPLGAMSDAEAQRRIEAAAAAEAEMLARSQKAGVDDVASFVNNYNGQSLQGGR